MFYVISYKVTFLFRLQKTPKPYVRVGIQTPFPILHVQVTVHRDNLRTNNQPDASSTQNFILSRNSTCLGHLLCPSSGVIGCTHGNWYVSCRLCGRCLGESGWYQPDAPRRRAHNLHETYQLPCVQPITPDDGHSRCPKHVEFRDKIKFWILDASGWLFVRRNSPCLIGL
jgi:hypothetical protein